MQVIMAQLVYQDFQDHVDNLVQPVLKVWTEKM
jgi:hypothetical protein